MRIAILIFILLTMQFTAIALETIFNPYQDIDYTQIKAYDYTENCECDCAEY